MGKSKTIFWMARIILGALVFVIAVVSVLTVNVKGTTINVDDSGGKDYAKIQDAINASSNGDTVYVYNGTYYENLTINKTINLIGENNQNTIIRGSDVEFFIGVYITANYVNMSNLKIGDFSYGIYLYSSSNNNITQNTITNCSGYGILIHSSSNNTITSNTITNSSGASIYLRASVNNNIKANTITNNSYGVYFHGSSNNNLTFNTIINNEYGFYLSNFYDYTQRLETSNNIVSINTIMNNSYGVYITTGDSKNIIVSNNIYSNKLYGLCADSGMWNIAVDNWWGNTTGPHNTANNSDGTGDNITDCIEFWPWASIPFNTSVSVISTTTEPKTITVDDSGGKDYTTIQTAINTASPGDTVYVYNGTYYEQLTITKSLTLVGESNQGTIIKGGYKYNSIGIHITATVMNVNISNVTIDSFYCGIYLGYSSNRNIITSNIITNTDVASVYLYFSSNNTIIDNTLLNFNTAIDNPLLNFSTSFQNNNISVIYKYLSGISLRYSSNNIITSNTITTTIENDSIEPDGINLLSSSNNKIISNTITNCTDGIYLYSSPNNTIIQNTITNCNGTYGGYGLLFYASSNNNIMSNTITNSDYGIALGLSSSNNMIISNNIYGNTQYGLYLLSDTGNTAYNNWWGSASGPYNAASNPTGIGDNITNGVPFSPWATEPFNISQSSITPQNHAPTISYISPRNTTVGTTFVIHINARDVDGDNLTYNASMGAINSTGYLTFMPTVAGEYNITIIVNDSKTQNQTTFVLTVGATLPVNHAPTITNITANRTTTNTNESVTIIVTATDEDNDALIYNYSATDGTILGNGSVAVWTAPSTDGDYTVTIIVSDGNLNATETINITVVNNTNTNQTTTSNQTTDNNQTATNNTNTGNNQTTSDNKKQKGFLPSFETSILIVALGISVSVARRIRKR